MGVHHIAFAAADMAATHRFYTEVMGFRLVKSNVAPTPQGGWAKHLFYATPGGDEARPGMIAFWELHVPELDNPKTAISTDLGLPDWVNHLAFDPGTQEAYEAAVQRMLDAGGEVVELDHEFCRSAYTRDPNGILVEWCLDTQAFTDADAERAEADLANPKPEFDPLPDVLRYQAERAPVETG